MSDTPQWAKEMMARIQQLRDRVLRGVLVADLRVLTELMGNRAAFGLSEATMVRVEEAGLEVMRAMAEESTGEGSLDDRTALLGDVEAELSVKGGEALEVFRTMTASREEVLRMGED